MALMNLQCCIYGKHIAYQFLRMCCTETYCKTSWWLGACWNWVIRRLFGYHKGESVSAVLLGLGKLDVKHLILLHKVNFYRCYINSCDTFLCDVFLIFLSDNACNNDVLMPVFVIDLT